MKHYSSESERMQQMLDHNSDPARFAKLPIVRQSAVCDAILAMVRSGDTDGYQLARGIAFVERHGMPHHREVLRCEAPPLRYANWTDFARFTNYQCKWQNDIFTSSRTLRDLVSVVVGTDELARA